MYLCVCGCVEPPLAVSPTALLLLLLLSLSCERAPVFVDFGVCLGQRQQRSKNNSNSSPTTPVFGFKFVALAQRLAEILQAHSLKHTHTHSNLPAYTLIHTCTRKQAHRHSQHIHKQTLSAHLLHFACALACCSWMLPLPLALLRFAALSSLANCNSLKFG